MHRLAVLAAVSALLAGCQSEQECTLLAARAGVGLEVEAPLAARAETVSMQVCWDGSCTPVAAGLERSSKMASATCSGDTCSATGVRTADKHGFGEVKGLPKRPVRIRLKLLGAGSDPVLDRTVEVTPRGSFPNGPGCGEGGPSTSLIVSGDGVVRER
ncbi:hypothetical protein [Nonomuraea zeae]|uniref:Lipoprotein n=1 Tax=Nonomuraea zeae TaxID=1642303 RepID=A0A5S4FPW7_9ACTN|nr:hypothetical protein [Nonomuraea zeae]TMR22755.1 hypothetical protein ETD85_48955 [Nonomuraea zeae]